MAKKMIKEMMIMLLLMLAIILILGVLLYEYVPSNKIIPNALSYTTPEAVQKELSKSEDVENDQIILTYSVDSTDLDNYERINTYVPGKANPFSPYDTSIRSGEDTTTQSESTAKDITQNESTTEETTQNGNSAEENNSSTFYPDTGTK